MRLSGRTAVVTGGARGIGAAVVRQLRDFGARVAVLDLEQTEGADHSVRCDVSQGSEVRDAFREVERSLGPVSVLINNAGIAPAGSFENLTEDDWVSTVAVNLTSVFLCTQVALPQLRACGGGSVTNVASIAGRHRSFTASAAYAAAKGGVIALTRQLAYEFAPDGIRVNCVCPGLVNTDIIRRNVSESGVPALVAAIPLGRLADAHEIADSICFLASQASSCTTGAIFDVNGGMF